MTQKPPLSKTPSAASIGSETDESQSLRKARSSALKSIDSLDQGEAAGAETGANALGDVPLLDIRAKKWEAVKKAAKIEMGGALAIHPRPEENTITGGSWSFSVFILVWLFGTVG